MSDWTAYDQFRSVHSENSPELFSVFNARHTYTYELLIRAAREGELAALIWMRAICFQTIRCESFDLMYSAASSGHLPILKHFWSGPDHLGDWQCEDLIAAAHTASGLLEMADFSR